MRGQSIDVTVEFHRECVGGGGQRREAIEGGGGGGGWGGGGLDLADSTEEVSQPSLMSSSGVCLLAEKPSCHQSSHTHNKGQLLSLQATKISITGEKMGESDTVVSSGGWMSLLWSDQQLNCKRKIYSKFDID